MGRPNPLLDQTRLRETLTMMLDHAMPTVALEMRLATELYRKRSDRYNPIIQYMKANGCDVDLLRRAMEAARLPQAIQENVFNQLS